MKKFLLLGFLITCTVNSFAFVTQGHWRWRKDDGSETTATWLAAEEATPTITSGSDVIRLRIEFFNSNKDASDLNTSVLTYSANGGVTWDSVSATAGTRAFVLAGSSPNVVNLDPTTNQLSGETGYTFVPGQVITSSNTLGVNSLAKKKLTEYEWVIKPTSKLLPNTTYLFKGDTKPGDNSYDGTAPPASLTTAAILPITLANFTVQQDKNRVKIQWSTASEQNNDHFAIERSADGKSNWQQVTTTKGKGTSAQLNTYAVYDNTPLNGKNYIRIKQYDADGGWQVSEIKVIDLQLTRAVVTVFPNPSKGDVNFSIGNYTGTVTATLTDVNGRTVHTEIFKAGNAAANYKLNLQKKLHSGIYILQVKGEGLSENVKVMVQ